jgi:CheY-like chemotaxis protein
LEARTVKQIKGDFLTKMGHEFRTPLNGIMNTSNLLLEGSLDEDQANLVNTIKGSSDALLATISDILDFSKIESGNLTLENIRFDLRETIESALDLVAEIAQSKNLELIADLDLDLPQYFLGDPFRLRQIILNLLGNSIKFTHHGEVRMRVTQMDATHSQHRIRFEVHDSGIGIDQETQKCLFQPFAQADTSASNQARGTGLGLATCRNLVDLLNGSIGITSDTGTGSTFWMGLPFATTNHSPKKESFDLRPINHLSPLIVHSNNNARTALDYSMGKIGLKAESDDCLESALERMSQSRLRSPRVNLIILDAGNDSWNDFSEIKQFRKSEFARNIPILLLIPFSKCPQKEEARRLGIYGWVTKPVKPRHLHNALFLDH